mmetsp:Transcript_2406/g.4634  ORF Transcript_2406/g.4634 Transcript_2406/m.4634 type:complete len:234 (+) Transcript_2406:175-876(+)|eukprot:CAMPEP_0184558264 /NCGR_PEP_ID=MMETSP0199_2-20130426/45025_1 /TAXON_ID=1112570 /ORGANISM="Thraustochytrium sp., Strain LLF1b" /LENGTH=233 /DNA_ID=CAMNT_0026955421 /DNA_START=83 /DNA_END=784 /DNA_ORIENTATION=-
MQAALSVGSCSLSKDELLRRIAEGIPPETGEEHFARARLEAAALPEVIVADKETLELVSKIEEAQTIRQSGGGRSLPGRDQTNSPSSTWRKQVELEFIASRHEIMRWTDRLVDGDVVLPELGFTPQKSDSSAWKSLMDERPPSLRLIMELEPKACYKVLKDMIYRFEEDETKQFQQENCAWLYALLARLETPLGAGMDAHLRGLLRMLLTHRSTSSIEAVDVIICILEDVFRV